MQKKIEIRSIIELIYSIDCLLPIGYIYLVKTSTNLFPKNIKELAISILSVNELRFYYKYKVFILGIAYLIMLLFLSSILLFLTNGLSKDSIKRGAVKEVEIATDSFLPSYLGYFFIALSINEWKVLVVIFIFIWLFIRKSKQVHFNPMFLMLGYKYYFITIDDVKSLLITKRNLRDPKNIESKNLTRINNYSFIEIKKEEE